MSLPGLPVGEMSAGPCMECEGMGTTEDGGPCPACDGTGEACEHVYEVIGQPPWRCTFCGYIQKL